MLASPAFPQAGWRQIRSGNPHRATHREIRRRTHVAGIVADRASIIRLLGAVLAERSDDRADGCRSLGLDVFAESRLTLITCDHDDEEDTPPAGAVSA